jgi:DEAD/DEAH box helicase domain-containing protein
VVVRTLEEREAEYYTIAMPQTSIRIMDQTADTRKSGDCILGRGGVTVRREVKLYREIPANAQSSEQGEIKTTRTDPIEYDSTAFWLDIPESLLSACDIILNDAHSAVHALEHALRSVFPFIADVDPGDLGSSLDIAQTRGNGFHCRLYLFDSFSGGTGLSDLAFEYPARLVDAATQLLSSCDCRSKHGCPRCTVLPWCESQNEDLWKVGAHKLLTKMSRIRDIK